MVVNVTDMEVKQIETTTYRLIPSRFPPIDLLERVAAQEDFDFLFEIESLTNDRLRDEVGEIALVAKEDRLFGDGTSLMMAPFTHPPVAGQGGRFNPDFGVFYCASEFETALEETKYHQAKFLLDFNSEPTTIDMRELLTDLNKELHTIQGKQGTLTNIYHVDDYSAGQELGAKLKRANSWGLEYDSVRTTGICYAVFRPPALSNCRQSRHFEYHFDGEKIAHVIEKSEVKLNKDSIGMRESLKVFFELSDDYVVLDTETTGLPDEEGQPGIVTLGLTKVVNRKIDESIEFKLRPYREIKKEAEKVHGISNEQANSFPTFEKKWSSIKSWLDEQVVVIHNKSFDWPIIEFHIEYYKCVPPNPIKIFCSQKSAIAFATEEGIPMSPRGPSLDDLTTHLNLESFRKDGLHGAKNDTIQTAFVVEGLRNLATL